MTNAFVDNDIRGFGLLQRDRDFVHYLDDSVFYERRPSVWVEPIEPLRFGLLAMGGASLAYSILYTAPLPLDFSTAYAAQSTIAVALLAAVALYAFRTSLGSRPIFKLGLDT